MVLQIIFFIGMYPVLWILYFVMRSGGDAKNGYSFGISMKGDWLKSEEMQQILDRYKKELKQISTILAVVPFVSFAVPYGSIQFTVWMLWILAVIGISQIPYMKANKKVLALKRQKGWQRKGAGNTYIELKNAGQVRRVHGYSFLAPTAISGVIAAWGVGKAVAMGIGAYAALIVTFAVITPLYYGIAVWMDEQKTEVVSNDSEVNLNYARAKKNVWKNLWLWLSWMNTAYTVFAVVVLVEEGLAVNGILWGSIVYTLLTFLFFLWSWRKICHIEACYVEKKDFSTEDSADDCWIWGIFYFNPKDKRVMVNKRAGIGTTMNMATPVGMGISLFGTVVILLIPICCIWLILEEFTPIHLAVEKEVLTAEHLSCEYEIPVEDIDGMEVLHEIPGWSKVSGTGMEKLEKGTFHIRNVGKCEVFLNPQNAVFLHFDADGTEYYMSGFDDEETMWVYEALKQQWT